MAGSKFPRYRYLRQESYIPTYLYRYVHTGDNTKYNTKYNTNTYYTKYKRKVCVLIIPGFIGAVCEEPRGTVDPICEFSLIELPDAPQQAGGRRVSTEQPRILCQ